ncbi:glycoside hydrolase family 55 protein [Thermothelomyces thermophilus ATCC 42464]|uniref:Glycoside hydrolase family 55 protein n=1 Tax=Thermothelomyces thermophilus (strain ATCC 42464 / BCRC 31852 / DSM 1799) TaxID=573729 RepID=G2QNT7_THET4|nr:glycoside hydrolase family 55 protein [Thermothelomyces thermophilus ATCC 42464]AEO62113.1 glycoside hydrolase family 55 protein [Thermothelomyces thermophilus ATCC 42464]
MTCKLTHRVMTQPNDPPVIKGAPSFVGLGVFSTDEYVPNGGTGPDGNAKEWYANFYRQIRNFKFDITQTDPNAYICAIHYQVAQATESRQGIQPGKTGVGARATLAGELQDKGGRAKANEMRRQRPSEGDE